MRLLTKATRMASNRGICCLSSLGERWDFGQRQLDRPPSGISAAFQVCDQDAFLVKGNQIGLHPAYLLPFKFVTKMRFWSKATRLASIRHICCLSSLRPRRDFGQRQPDWPPSGISAAFQVWDQDAILVKGNQIGLQLAYLLPLVLSSKIGSRAEAAKSCFLRLVCCLWPWWVSLGPGQKQQNPASWGLFAAFDLGEFHWTLGRSSKILLPWACLLPLTLVNFIGHLAEAAKSCFLKLICCLWPFKQDKWAKPRRFTWFL